MTKATRPNSRRRMGNLGLTARQVAAKAAATFAGREEALKSCCSRGLARWIPRRNGKISESGLEQHGAWYSAPQPGLVGLHRAVENRGSEVRMRGL